MASTGLSPLGDVLALAWVPQIRSPWVMLLPQHGSLVAAVPQGCLSLLAGVTYGCSPSGAYFWYEATPAQSVSPAAFPALCLPLLTDDSVFLKPV